MESPEAHQAMKEDDDIDATSVATSTFFPTGTATPQCEFATGRFRGDVVVRDAAPQAGDTFIIMETYFGGVITVIEGKLRLKTSPNRAGSWRWLCTEKDGFLGFRNTVSGRYLGRNFWWDIVVEGGNHKYWEHFHARRQPGGGYTLLVPDWFTMRQISMGGGGNTLAADGRRGTVFEFMKVEDD